MFVIIPIATAILIAAAIYIVNSDSRGYTAEGKVFVGGVDQKELTDPEVVKAKYQDVKGLDDIYVSEKGKMKFRVKVKSKSEAEQVLDQVRNQYFADLKKNGQLKIEITTKQLTSLENRVKTLDSNLILYNKRLSDPKTDTYEAEDYRELIGKSMDELNRASERAYKMRGDIALFSHPEILPAEVHKAKSYIPESIAIGIILGLILTVALLTLMKYLSDARRYYKERGSFLD